MMDGGIPGWAEVSLLIILAIVLTVARALTRSAEAADAVGQILDERLARDEITPEQYRACTRPSLARAERLHAHRVVRCWSPLRSPSPASC